MRSSRTEPMNCGITPSDPLTVTEPASGVDLAGQQAQQRGLARAVRADQGGRLPLADPERDVRQQQPAIRQVVIDVRRLDVCHPRRLASG